MTSAAHPSTNFSRQLRVGFLALTDSAPIIVAQALGLFSRNGLDVELSREVGWATIREKITYGELHAAHAPAPMLWATHLGIDCVPTPVLSALILNQHGNAITLSERLWKAGVTNAATFREEAKRRTGERRITLGVVFRHSSHHLFLRRWLLDANISPENDVRIVVVPPAQMYRNLVAGTIDGYCAGEPWNTVAISEGAGWCPTWSAQYLPGHVEKVLMVTRAFATQRNAEHAALISAIHAACQWCNTPANRVELANLLSYSAYLHQPAPLILPALPGHSSPGHGQKIQDATFLNFHQDEANRPTLSRANQIQTELINARLLSPNTDTTLPRQLFREDIFLQSLSTTHELVTK